LAKNGFEYFLISWFGCSDICLNVRRSKRWIRITWILYHYRGH